ncbi:putative NRPS-like protein biosynthetic cluster, partial [Pestalotiopsis sp. IQ-011]
NSTQSLDTFESSDTHTDTESDTNDDINERIEEVFSAMELDDQGDNLEDEKGEEDWE